MKQEPKAAKPKKDTKKKPNILSAEDKINEFMRKMHHKDGDGLWLVMIKLKFI